MSTTVPTHNHAAYFQTIKPGKCHTVDFDNTSKQVGPFSENTTLVRVFPTQDCYVKIGTDPTVAVPTEGSPKDETIFLPGGMLDFIGVVAGGKISVTRKSTSGTLEITEAQ